MNKRQKSSHQKKQTANWSVRCLCSTCELINVTVGSSKAMGAKLVVTHHTIPREIG